VHDIGAALQSLEERGGEVARFDFFEQDARGVWSAGDGVQVAWFRDPDGNLLSLTQMPPDA
jgi:hypothetical protein